jgi:FkbM family methyltransferase
MHLRTTTSRAATLFAKNPGLFCRVMLGKLNSARPMPQLPARKRIGDVVFECELDNYHATAEMYFGSYAPLVVDAMKHYLRPGDIFLDVGANVGYLSAIAASLVGTTGQVHAFEPVPFYFERLRHLAVLNPDFQVHTNHCAVGDVPGISTMYIACEPGQSTLVRDYKSSNEIASTLDVPVVRLDSYISAQNMRRIALIKIDVEGFELAVLKSLKNYLDESRNRPPIVCEIAPRAYSLLSQSRAELAAFMASYGYSARDLTDRRTRVDVCALDHVDDVLFLADK